eukprot:comp15939_c0_seq1/m.13338 comp15939_c0_seq1/g.13338  ORF comp15939_c0_seq1/g.13338 comp15939_c0_seq1/m.13338 type:complete len:236 (-) comp15939_c0_seq1:169-876(-)
MFSLAIIKDVIRIAPADFQREFSETVAAELNAKYANKVVPQVGLCIILFDIIKYGDQYIYPGDGAAFVEVEFRYVVFRPFVGEVLVGKVRSCNPAGIQVTMGFFDDIFIPGDTVPYPSKFDREEQVWVWSYQGHNLTIDPGQDIRFRVISESFQDVAPPSTTTSGPVQPRSSSSLPPPPAPKASEANKSDLDSSEVFKQSPYTLTCSINDDGLGLLLWWHAEEEEEEDGAQEDAE